MATVRLDDVSKVYPGKQAVKAVDNVTIHIADREFLVLVGPSGCGKSTTLRMVAGLEDISSGTISIGDNVVNDVAPKDRDVAMVFQNYALYPHMTVYKNMAFGLKMRKVPKAEIHEKVTRAAKMLGIEHLLQRKPKALSGGERQRVAVGRAIVRTPRAFLFDEPLSNLDARLRIQMRAELKKLHRELQTTAIYVTHDQEEAMTLGDRIAVMKGGIVQQCASPVDVYERPANRFVAGFVGIPPMNFFEGRVVQADGRLRFDTGYGMLDIPQGVATALGNRTGDALVYGARPEVLTLNADPAGGGLDMKVTVIEILGSDKDVYLEAPRGGQVVARVPVATPVTEGSRVLVGFDAARVHLFETGETGVNVGLNGYGAAPSAN
ncbi:MAG: sn-glycerol-3-phosphate ABC transporter ATP-binding protein UgpC [Phycisphaerales bacterium]|nr:sn-glycerol-3-phosphate ABC transporter ATP-binding protein UgpC [Phycisphaerales bacterium]